MIDRRKYIGGSAVAAVLGLSPWSTPLKLYEFMTSEGPPEPLSLKQEKFFARRKRQEPVVAEMLADEYGIEVTRLSMDGNPNRYTDPDLPFLAAEVDFEFILTDSVKMRFPDRDDLMAIPSGTLVNGEIKTVHPFAASEWGEHGSEEVPVHYAAQVMHGLGVTRRPIGFIAALFGLDQLQCFPIVAETDTIQSMREACVNFWGRVQNRIPPPPSTTEEVQAMLNARLGRPIILDAKIFNVFMKRMEAAKSNSMVEKDIAEADWLVAKYIADAWDKPLLDGEAPNVAAKEDVALVYDGKVVGTWNRQRGKSLDQRRLKAEHTALVEPYIREHWFRVFRRKGK
jgi:putative phage-type endonuclease